MPTSCRQPAWVFPISTIHATSVFLTVEQQAIQKSGKSQITYKLIQFKHVGVIRAVTDPLLQPSALYQLGFPLVTPDSMFITNED